MSIFLPRLPNKIRIVLEDGSASTDFQRWWEEVSETLEGAITGLEATVTAVQAAQAAAEAAQASATAAQVAAEAAQDAADGVQGSYDLTSSYTTGMSLTATDAGADATINISSHTRIYGNGTSVAVTFGAVTGLIYDLPYWVYYDQASRAGGVVAYQVTTNYPDAFSSGANPDRHFVGAITTPAAGMPDTVGNPVVPGGYQPA